MGRIMSFGQDGQLVRDFDKSEYDFLRRYGRTPDEVMAENVKLREQLAKARDPQRIGGTADPESFVYAIEQLREFRWQHATNDEEAIPYINNVADAHERENAKLREFATEAWKLLTCNEPNFVWSGLQEKARKLGIEVK